MIFAIDLDGTLLGTDKKIRTASKRAITKAQKKGHIVIPITGRSFMGVKDIIKELKIEKYAVINNGSSIYNVRNKHFHSYPPVGKNIINELMDIAKREGAQFSIHGETKTIRCSFVKDKTSQVIKNDWATTLTKGEFKKQAMKMKVMQISMKSTRLITNKWSEILREKYFGVYQIHATSNIYLDINFNKVSKYEALLWIIEKEKLNLDDLIAFGDSDNDVQMIIGAKIGIAMANATELVIEKANEVITSNDTDAIANKISELI